MIFIWPSSYFLINMQKKTYFSWSIRSKYSIFQKSKAQRINFAILRWQLVYKLQGFTIHKWQMALERCKQSNLEVEPKWMNGRHSIHYFSTLHIFSRLLLLCFGHRIEIPLWPSDKVQFGSFYCYVGYSHWKIMGPEWNPSELVKPMKNCRWLTLTG